MTVLRLDGAIGAGGALRRGLSLDGLAPAIAAAFRPAGLTAVALAINSPGGAPVQSALIAQRIRDLAAEKKVPVHAFCEDVAASGGYWLACAGDEIHAMPGSIVGSIGVVSAGFGFQELIRRHGIERRVHTAGEKKVILDPFQPEDPEDAAHLERLQQELHAEFIALVKERRGGRLKAGDETLFDGTFWSGRRAFDLGLVDGLGEARSVLRGRYGERVRLRPVGPPKSLLRRVLAPGPRATGGAGLAALPQAALATAAEQTLWQRYGL